MGCSIIRNSETKEIERVLAPNGKDSILYDDILSVMGPESKEDALTLWAQVYTPEFKDWFGDWERLERIKREDPGMDMDTMESIASNVSKDVDSNGEPRLSNNFFTGKNGEVRIFYNALETNNEQINQDFLIKIPLTEGIIEVPEFDDNVNYKLKASQIISFNLNKVNSLFKQLKDTDLFWNKIQQDLQIPKEQVALLRESKGETIEEKLAAFTANYSYTVEINVAKRKSVTQGPNDAMSLEEREFFRLSDLYKEQGLSEIEADKKAREELKSKKEYNTQYYSYLTVPGGTNYTENEIATPAITPAIKGHAQFATPNGIGWFRSDVQALNQQALNSLNQRRFTSEQLEMAMINTDGSREALDAYLLKNYPDRTEGTATKTRRILEVQSDLFQKGRDKEELVKVPVSEALLYKLKNIGVDIGQKFNVNNIWFEVFDKKIEGSKVLYNVKNLSDETKTSWVTTEKIYNSVKSYYETKNVPNNFLQLLNKGSNWVTFFVKSIIQDSAKKGFEKVLFPSGNTASKVEGQTTLEGFKKQKEDRIKVLEENNEIIKPVTNTSQIPRTTFRFRSQENETAIVDYVKGPNGKYLFVARYFPTLNSIVAQGQTDKYSPIKSERKPLTGSALINAYNTYISEQRNSNNNEINQLKQELERVDREGFGALRPIYNFYETTISNVLKKQGYNPKSVKDEYGNTWNEVDISEENLDDIYFQLRNESDITTVPSVDLNTKINKFLERIGVAIQSVNEIRDAQGNIVSDAVAKADMLNKIIQVADGLESLDTLPEEAAHFFVELLGPGHPLYKEMFSKITSYQIYPQVVEQYKNKKAYRNSDGTINFDKIKKEAIGKVISEHILQMQTGSETEQRLSFLMNWWNRLWNFVKSIFNKAEDNPFELAASSILNNDIGALDTELELDEEYYQLADPVQGLKLDQANINLDNSIDPRTGQKRHVYKYKGVDAKGSVTSTYVDKWLKKIFRSDQRSDRQKLIDLNKAEFGDVIHEQAQRIIDSWTYDDGTKRSTQGPVEIILPPAIYTRLNNYLQSVMAQYEPGTIFMSEVKVFDQKAKIGGSIDLLVIQPNGVVDIYDWKSQEVARSQTDLKTYKETMYRIQLENYRKILQLQYGFQKFGKIRSIPMRTRFNFKNGQIDSIRELEIGNIDPTLIPDDKSYLLPVTLRTESTGDTKLDDLLEKLNGIYDKIDKSRYSKEELYKKREELAQLRSAIRDLQLKNKVDRLVELGLLEYKKYSEMLNNKTLTGNEIQDAIKILEVFSESGILLYDLMKDYSKAVKKSKNKTAKAEFDKLNKRFLTMTSEVGNLIKSIESYREDQVKDLAVRNGIFKILDPEAPVSTYRGQFSALSNISQASFRLFSKLLRVVQNSRDARFDSTAAKMVLLKKKFLTWASAKGLSPEKAMEMILQIDENGNWNGNFLNKYKSDFRVQRTAAIQAKNTKWLVENMSYDPDKYNEAEKRTIENFKSINYALDEEVNQKIIDKKIKEWSLDHKVVNDNGTLNVKALLNPSNGFLTPNDVWLTEKWKDLQKPENKILKDVYDFFQGLTDYAEDLGMLDRKSKGFIPSVFQSKIDQVVFGNIKNLFSTTGFFENLQVDAGNTYTPEIDPTDGSIINRIPVYFTNDIGSLDEKTGQMDYSKKSRDLFKVFAIFSAHMYNYEAMQSIEDSAQMLVEVERNKKSLVTDAFGNITLENGKPKAANNNDRNAKIFEDFVNMYIYDRLSGRAVDTKFKILGKEYSLIKSAQAAMRFFSLKTLALNPVSGTAQFVGGTGNALFMAQKGIYFTNRTWAKAMYATSGSKKAWAALKFMNILGEGNTNVMIDELSLSATNQILSDNNFYVFMRLSDKAVQYPVAIAMMMEHMVVNDKIVNIQQFVKAKYDYNNKFYDLSSTERKELMKKIDAEVGELQEKESVYVKGVLSTDGEFTIPGIDKDSEAFSDFRNKIKGVNKRIVGNQSRDDINRIRTTLLGQALMQFRSWMPEMIEERFEGLRYDDELQNWTYGKFHSFFGDLFSKRIGRLLKAIMTGFGDDAINLAKEKYENLKRDAYEKGENFTITEGEFIDLHIGNLRSMMVELMTLSSFAAAVLSITSGDDENRRNKGMKQYMARALKKYYNEFAFYYNPIELTKLTKSPLPVISLAEDMSRFIGNVLEEGAGQISGNEEWTESAKPLKYFTKMVPIAKEGMLIFATYDEDFRKDWDIRIQPGY
jgi:hypothetical protein